MDERKLDNIKAVVIGSSTGGPKILLYLIENIPENLSIPIFIVQHMPKDFTTIFAARLNRDAKVKVVEAEDNMKIENGVIYIAPGDYHMTIEKGFVKLNQEEKLYGVRPAVDYLFKSASKEYGKDLLGIILTGMGRDGTLGMKTIKNNGGYNIAQDKESSVIHGMPGNAIASGVVDKILGVEEISSILSSFVKVK